MSPRAIFALLSDSADNILLARRKDSLLWTLPGNVVRPSVASHLEFLIVCCRRQVGVTPDFVAPLFEFTFSGQSVAIGTDEIPHDRARACGRVAESRWFRKDALPLDLAPIARMAINLHGDHLAGSSNPVSLAVAC